MKAPKVLILGPIFNTKAGPSGQGGQLYMRLSSTKVSVSRASHFRNKILRMLHSIFAVIRIWRYNLIHLQSFGLLAFVLEDVVSIIARITGKPIIFTLRGGAFYEFYEKHPKWVRRVLNRATVITSPSFFLSSKFNELGFEIRYVPNAIELEKFLPDRAPKRHSLLWVRAFHDIYNPELAIKTVSTLKDQYPDVHLTMIGPSQGLLDSCIELIHNLNLEKHISLLGYVPNDKLSDYYNSHQVYLNTTRYESFGVALVEAGACGIPTVSTAVGEIPLIWKDGANILLAQRDEQDFAQKITALFEDTKLYEHISSAAIKNSQKYSWSMVLPEWIALYNEIIDTEN